MPALKTRMLFISHAWKHSEHYWKVVEWLNSADNFSWKNCSVPNHDSLPDKTSAGLKRGMTRQISPSQAVLIFGGMYAAHSDWIEYEITEAQRMGKVIIGVRPWAQQRVPQIVTDASVCPVVSWQSASIIQAVRDYT